MTVETLDQSRLERGPVIGVLAQGWPVRAPSRSDCATLVRLLLDDPIERDRGPEAHLEGYLRAFDEMASDTHSELVLVEGPDGDVAATMQLVYATTLSWRGARRAYLQGVRVASQHRGQGVGTQMIGWAVSRARDRGCAVVQLSSDNRRTEAHRFYAQLGFQASHVGMRLVLPAEEVAPG